MTRPKITLSIQKTGGKTRSSKKRSHTPSSSRTIMPERGIDVSGIEAWLDSDISTLGWEMFVEPPQQANSEFVMEFLRVAEEKSFPIIKIKGVDVNFSEDEMNESFNTDPVPKEKDEYEAYCQATEDKEKLGEILETISSEGTEWGAGGSLQRKQLKFESKVWMHFINSRLIPGSHDTRVNWERAVLAFCIIKKKKFDVGRIVYGQLVANLEKKGPFYFPCLVSELCRRAGLKASDPDVEETIPLASPIDQNTLKRIRKNEGLEIEETEEVKEVSRKDEEEQGEEMSETNPQDKPARKKPNARPAGEKKKSKLFEASVAVSEGLTMFGRGADLLARSIQNIEVKVLSELDTIIKAAGEISQEKELLEQKLEQNLVEEQPSKKRRVETEDSSGMEKALAELTSAINIMKQDAAGRENAQNAERYQWQEELKGLREELEGMRQKDIQFWAYVKARDQVFDVNWDAKFKKQERFPSFPDILPPAALTSAPEDGATTSKKRERRDILLHKN